MAWFNQGRWHVLCCVYLSLLLRAPILTAQGWTLRLACVLATVANVFLSDRYHDLDRAKAVTARQEQRSNEIFWLHASVM